MSNRHWSQIGEVTMARGIKVLFVLHRALGRWPFRVIMYPTVTFYLLRHSLARRSSREYLTRVFRSIDPSHRDASLWQSVRHVAVFAESLLEKLRIWSGELKTEDVIQHNRNVVSDEVEAGRGGMIFVSHLGNIEVCRALTTRKSGIKLNVLVHTKHAVAFNALLAELNPKSELNIVQVTDVSADTVIRLREKVDRGEYIVIACDRVAVTGNSRVTSVDFLGASARFPVGPYVLASLLQCPTYLLFCIAEQGRYHMYFERFRERIVLPRASRDSAIADAAQEFASRLAYFCQRAPYQWFNFYDFWGTPQMERTDA